MSVHPQTEVRLNINDIVSKKGKEQVPCLTAYDYTMATWCDRGGADLILVGDSAANVVFGETTTLPITLDTMILISKAVMRGTKRAVVVLDLPFMSYQVSPEDAVRNAGRAVKESGVLAVKLEGGAEFADTVKAITRASIPVMAHIGLMPQSALKFGKFRTFGKTPEEQTYLRESALRLQDAGAFAVVLECVYAPFAAELTQELFIPTIGIGSGVDVDGQILVTHDLLGMTVGKAPKFAQPVAQLGESATEGVRAYVARTLSRTGI